MDDFIMFQYACARVSVFYVYMVDYCRWQDRNLLCRQLPSAYAVIINGFWLHVKELPRYKCINVAPTRCC